MKNAGALADDNAKAKATTGDAPGGRAGAPSCGDKGRSQLSRCPNMASQYARALASVPFLVHAIPQQKSSTDINKQRKKKTRKNKVARGGRRKRVQQGQWTDLCFFSGIVVAVAQPRLIGMRTTDEGCDFCAVVGCDSSDGHTARI